MVADEKLRPAGEVGELRAGNIDAQLLIERREDVAEMNRPGAWLLAPAVGGAEDLAVTHAAAGYEGTANPWPVIAAAVGVDLANDVVDLLDPAGAQGDWEAVRREFDGGGFADAGGGAGNDRRPLSATWRRARQADSCRPG